MNIIVNGGTRGIGKEVAQLLSDDKMNLILVTGRNKVALEQLSEKAENNNIVAYQTDLENFDTNSESFLEIVKSHFSHIDILINCAGSLISSDFMQFRNSDARKMMEVNFFGPASVIRLLKPLMSKESHIVNISSMGGFQGSSKFRGLSYYSASKAALACLSECLAVEFSDSGVSVNCLALGSVRTEMLQEAFPGYRAPVSAKEMAEYIVQFAMNGNKYFNGKILPVAMSNP